MPRVQELQRRRDAALRCEPLDCGHRDPWTCRCRDEPPSEVAVDGYRAALRHLDATGLGGAPRLPELRMMWRRGGTDRDLALRLSRLWELLA